MSKIDELLKKLCPNGVEQKQLGELGSFYGGLTGKTKDDFKDGNEKFITYMNIYSNISININVEDKVKVSPNERQNLIEYGDVLFTGSSETPDECGISSVLTQKTEEKLYLNSFCFGFRFENKNLFLPDFSKYLFRSDGLRKQIVRTASGVTRFNVSKEKMSKVVIPVPPLEAQREIVQILDKFTLLTAELTAELTARQKQYEYYRNKLLSQNSLSLNPCEIRIAKLSDVCDINAGGDVPKNNYSILKSGKYMVPIISNGIEENAIYGYTNVPVITKKAVTVAARGTIGWAAYRDYPYFPIVRLLSIIPKNELELIPKYLYYCLQGRKYKIPKAGIPQLTIPMLSNETICIPRLDIQTKIVTILDNFDSICKNLNIGLPAEIEARQKQYEYYRDSLFKYLETRNVDFVERERERERERNHSIS